MRKLFINIIIALMVVFTVFMVVGWNWSPMGSGTPPRTRTLITDIRENIEPTVYATWTEEFIEFPRAALLDTTSVVVDIGSIVSIKDTLGVFGLLKFELGLAAKGILNGMNLQTTNAPLKLIASPANPDSDTVLMSYQARVMMDQATQSELYAGLTIEDESLSTGQTYGMFFVKHDNSTTIYAKEIKASVAAMDSVDCGTFAADTWYDLRIDWNGASARFYINDVKKATLTTTANQPIGSQLKPTIEMCSGDSTVVFGYLDLLYARQRR